MEGDRVIAADSKMGAVRIADEVVAVIAGLAATEIPGVTGMSGGIVGGIVEMLGRKNLSKGVKVEVGEQDASIDLFMVVDFGVSIPQVAEKVQDKVREAIEKMTGLRVIAVNVHIQGIGLGHDEVASEGRGRLLKVPGRGSVEG